MAVRTVTGLFGGGKSYYGVREVVEELRWGARTIVTNLPLKLPELREYLQKLDPKGEYIDINRRIRILSEEDSREFYLHRGNCDVPGVTAKEAQAGIYQKYPPEAFEEGVLYILDEADKIFSARNFQNYSMACSYYLTQHRKLSDEIIFIAPVLGHLDKQLRDVTAEFLYVKNTKHERVWGFRGPGYLLVKAYNEAQSPGRSGITAWTKRYTLDEKGLGNCYDTMSGVGISGRKKPEDHKKKGLSLWWAVAAGMVFVIGIAFAPAALNAGVRGVVGMSLPDKPEKTSKEEPQGKAPSPTSKPSTTVQTESKVLSAPSWLDEEVRRYAALQILGRKVRIVLENGVILNEDNPHLERIDRDGVVWISGIPFYPPKQPEPEPFDQFPSQTGVESSQTPAVGGARQSEQAKP